MRSFDTGATRDNDEEKLDFESFLSPQVLVRYAEYMHKHRIQSDGSLRDGDNWQKGMPLDVYMKSLMRHVMDLWLLHRNKKPITDTDIENTLCAVLFNAMGYLFTEIQSKGTDGELSPVTYGFDQTMRDWWRRKEEQAWQDLITT